MAVPELRTIMYNIGDNLHDPDDTAFVEPCERCSGFGKIRHSAYISVLCVECEGTGRALTMAGKRLIAFLRALGVSMPTPDGWRSK